MRTNRAAKAICASSVETGSDSSDNNDLAGQISKQTSHLIKVVCEVATGKRKELVINVVAIYYLLHNLYVLETFL